MAQLTILMPCLNEAETIGTCIKKAKDWAKTQTFTTEVLIADNGSTDGSIEIAESLGARVVRVKERGYGEALFAGCQAAAGEWIIMGDADDSYNFASLDPFVEKFQEGYELVMGNRFQGGIADGAMPWKNRHIGNPTLSFVGRALFRIPVRDFHCGLRGITKQAFERIDLRTSGMEFASEMVIKAAQRDLRIVEVPTTLDKDGRSRPPHLRPYRDGWRHLRFMMLFSPRWLFLIPGAVLLAVSLVLYIRLLLGPLSLGVVSLDIRGLFFAQTGALLGLLAVLTAVATRAMGTRDGMFVEHQHLRHMANYPVSEIGAVVGALLVLAGGIVGLTAVAGWGASENFGTLAADQLMRSVSLSTFLLSVGGLIFVFSLIVGFISLPVRRELAVLVLADRKASEVSKASVL